jgi:hypothetical protein
MADAPGSVVGVDDCVNSSANLTAGSTLGVGGIPGGQGDTAVNTAGSATVPDAAAQRVGNTLSMEFWWRRATLGVRQGLMAGAGSGTGALRINTNDTIEFFCQSIGSIMSTSVAISDTTNFHHIIVTKAGNSSAHFYIDGVDRSGGFTSQGLGSTNGLGWVLMADFVSGSATGVFTYMALYPLALSLGQAQDHYTLGITGTPPSNSSPPIVAAIGGHTFAGYTIASTPGVWIDLYGGGVISYQWQRDRLGDNNFQNVSGTNGPAYNKYVLKRADYGCNFRCVTTMTNSGGTASATSNPIGPVYILGTMGIPIGVPR